MTTPMPEQCGASARIQIGPMPYIGPCVLRHGHDGPVHQDADGAQWTDPRPATAEDSAALCPPKQPDPHPYVHLTYGPWEPSGHQCWDIQPGGCDDVPPERKVFARWNGIGEEQFVGWDLGDCPSCGPAGLRDQLAHAMAHAPGTVYQACNDDMYLRLADAAMPVVQAALAQTEQQRDDALRDLAAAHEAWTAVREESAALIAEYNEPAPKRENRCGSCRQHETVDRTDAAARAMAKTARRYKRQRDDAHAAVQRVRELHVRDDSNPHGPWCGVCLTPWPCRTRLAAEPDTEENQ